MDKNAVECIINKSQELSLDQAIFIPVEREESQDNEESIFDQEKKRLEEEGRRAVLQVTQAQDSLEDK